MWNNLKIWQIFQRSTTTINGSKSKILIYGARSSYYADPGLIIPAKRRGNIFEIRNLGK